jgi:zinc transport system ATP-binding protein
MNPHYTELRPEGETSKACGLCCTRIEHLSVCVGKTPILNDVNLHIHCGELTALVGRNGAGKTTLLRALLGEIPHRGNIVFAAGDGTNYGKPRFGYVPQRLEIAPNSPLSVSDLIVGCLTRWPAWLPLRERDRALVHQVLEKTDAAALATKRICDLSGGELQRVMLALALSPLPDILLLDEPVSGVDRKGLIGFYQLVSDIRKKNDLTILLVSHDLDIVARHADRVVLIDGTVAAEGRPHEVFTKPIFIETFGNITLNSDVVAGDSIVTE